MFIGNEAEQGQIKTQLGARMYSSTKWFKKKHQKGGGGVFDKWVDLRKTNLGKGGGDCKVQAKKKWEDLAFEVANFTYSGTPEGD